MSHVSCFIRFALPFAGLVALVGCGSASTGAAAAGTETFEEDAGSEPVVVTRPKPDMGNKPPSSEQPSVMDAGAPKGDGGGDGNGEGGAKGDGGKLDGGAVCANIVNGAPQIVSERVSGNVPQTTGGAMQPGTYFLTSARFYNGNNQDEAKLKRTLVVKGTAGDARSFTFESINESQNTFAGTYKTFNRDLDRGFTCPAQPGLEELGYSATASTLTLAFFESGVSFTYTKQP